MTREVAISDCYIADSVCTAEVVTLDNVQTAHVARVTFVDNYADVWNGCLYLGTMLRAYVEDSTFQNCTLGTGNGAAIATNRADFVNITSCAFNDNAAKSVDYQTEGYGGGLSLYDVAIWAVIHNCTFCRNSAGIGGGGIAVGKACYPAITDCLFEGNLAKVEGGGYHYTCAPAEQSCKGDYDLYADYYHTPVFSWVTELMDRRMRWYGLEDGNVSTSLFHDPGHTMLANCTFRDNNAQRQGGAFALTEGTLGIARQV